MNQPLFDTKRYTIDELRESAVIVHPKNIEKYGISVNDVGLVFEEGSNFTRLKQPIMDEYGNEYWDSEGYYMSQRINDPEIKKFIAFCSIGQGLSKKAAYEFKDRINNNPQERLKAMQNAVQEKYSRNFDQSQILLNTGNREIIELTYWGDTFFGISHKNLSGFNILGKLLMQKREEVRSTLQYQVVNPPIL